MVSGCRGIFIFARCAGGEVKSKDEERANRRESSTIQEKEVVVVWMIARNANRGPGIQHASWSISIQVRR